MKDTVKEAIDKIVGPGPDIFGDPDDPAVKQRRAALAHSRDDGGEGEITEEALDEAEIEMKCETAEEEAGDLGDFSESDYAGRIAGWQFKTELIYVSGREIEVYYRRPLGSPGGTTWERIGHAESPDALELRRLVYCANQRDEGLAEEERRRELIESLFGAGSVPLVESLIAAGRPEKPGPAALTPRQEAFCRHYLTEPSGTRAAIKAGYAETSAANEASRLMRK